MTPPLSALLRAAVEAARRAGKLQREAFSRSQHVTEIAPHDIKLEMDVRSQQAITQILLKKFPAHALLGEEGDEGQSTALFRWIVDPLDGTANYAFGVPHFAVSIAGQKRISDPRSGAVRWKTVVGVVYDPKQEELFTATDDGPARLNGRAVRVAKRCRLAETMMVIGIFKDPRNINASLRLIRHFVHRTRKLRHMGSAALNTCYVACGRFDAYLESGVKIWDIAAGRLIIERAGGICDLEPTKCSRTFNIFASSRAIRPILARELRRAGGL